MGSLLVSQNNLSRAEHGIILPLAAVVLLGVVSLLFAAGVDSLLVRMTRSHLQDIAQRVCQAVAHDVVAPDAAVDGFREGIQNIARTLNGAQLKEASLIMALPNEASLPSIEPAYLCTADDRLTPADPVAAEPVGGVVNGHFSKDFGLPKCEVPGLTDCTLWAYPNVQLPPGVPEEARDVLLPGRGLGCAIAAEVIGTPFQVFTRTTDARPLVRAQAVYSTVRTRAGAVNNVIGPRGLRLAISTQLATPPLELAPPNPAPGPDYPFRVETLPFSFGATRRHAGPSAEALDKFIHLHDPLCAPPHPSNPSDPWCKDYRLALPLKIPSLAHTRAFSGPRPSERFKHTPHFMRGGLELTESQRMEMLISCINPPVLIRNIIAATIVGLAARDPVLRRHTEILHINPLEVQTRRDEPFSFSIARNPSTIMVPMGEDITKRGYQIPLVHFRQDAVVNSDWQTEIKGVGAFDVPYTAGSLYPLSNSALPHREHDEVIHSELANQLRRCLHLYTDLEDGARDQESFRGLSAINVPLLTQSRYGLLTSDTDRGAFSFHSMLYQGSGTTPAIENEGRYGGVPAPEEERIAYDLDPDLFPENPLPKAQPQGNESPWDPPLSAQTNSRRLTAMELVSVLGSSQRCPYSDMNGGSSEPNNIWCPSDPEAPSEWLSKERIYKGLPNAGVGLQPDYDSLIEPLVSEIGSNYAQENWLRPPQVITRSELYLLDGQSELVIARSSPVRCKHSGLIVLTHSFGNSVYPPLVGQAGADSSNLSLNEKSFEKFRAVPLKDQSPLVIVVVPTISNVPRMGPIESNLFGSSEFVRDPDVHILMLAPSGCLDSKNDTPCTDKDFHRYWAEVLDPNNPSYVEYMARDFFSSIINRGAPKRVL